MARLNLLLADPDEDYLAHLAKYLQSRHSDSFSVNYVTAEGHLKEYLTQHRDSMDILLVSPGFSRALYTGMQTTVILISDGRLEEECVEHPVLEKFQRGDQLASRVLQIYLEKNPRRRFINTAFGSNRLIGIFSPSGGCGKSVLSAGLSAIAHQHGKRAMYLNLEGCESTEAWFPKGCSPSISELFYHIKEGGAQLTLKLEALSYRDPVSRVQSFMSADTLLDFNDLTEADLELLADELRKAKGTDVVFLDLSASVESKNLKLIELMDLVLLPVADEPASQIKVEQFVSQFPTLERKRNAAYSGKTILIQNSRYGRGFRSTDTRMLRGVCCLPKDPSLRSGNGISSMLGGPFGRSLTEVWNQLGLE